MIHLRHPIHGVKIAYSQAEADADKANEWVEYDPTEYDHTEVVEPIVKRRGRPPKVK